jgi:hypothetical protein
MLHSQDPRTMLRDQAVPISIEAQFPVGLGAGKPRPTLKVCIPGTEIIYEGRIYPSHCLESSSKTFDGDQWIKAEFVVLGSASITHLLEGQSVLEYNLPQYDHVKSLPSACVYP